MERIEIITDSILAEAKADADSVIAAANAKAAEISASYASQAKELYDRRVAAGSEELEQSTRLAERSARLDAKKSLLAEKQKLLNAAYAKAAELLSGMDRDEYLAFLLKKLDGAALSGGESLVLNAGDKASIGAELIQKANAAGRTLRLSDETGDFSGGFILKDGKVETNCTIDALIEMSRSDMDTELVGIMFG